MFFRGHEPQTYVAGIATIVVAVAVQRMPYGYYTLLRLFLCATCVYYLVTWHRAIGPGLNVLLGACAVLYNPIAPVYLREKYLWTAANVVTLAILYISIFAFRRNASHKTR